MPPKKDTSAGKGKGKAGAKGGDKRGKDKDQKRGPKLSKCRTPLATGAVMAQRAMAPTVCCPSQGTAVRCCLSRPGC